MPTTTRRKSKKFKKLAGWVCDDHRAIAVHNPNFVRGEMIVLQHGTRCRECGEFIEPGETAVKFEPLTDYDRYWGAVCYIHEKQCTPGTIEERRPWPSRREIERLKQEAAQS